jgi:hypothetical protein
MMATTTIEKRTLSTSHQEHGFGLIIVILIMAFLLSTGIVLTTITSTGSKISGNVRAYNEAFNAAEAGFDASWRLIENTYLDGNWADFGDQYLTEPSGIDLPLAANYFRRLTDEQVLNALDPSGDGVPDVNNVLFFRQPYIVDGEGTYDLRYTYTCFLINDEAGGGSYNANDALLICIGVVDIGGSVTTSRIEIVLETG